MNVVFVGGFWATNIGNSFYDLGAKFFLDDLEKFASVKFYPDLADHFWKNKANFEPMNFIDCDLIIFGGPIIGDVLLNYSSCFDYFMERGVKVGFLSAGLQKYQSLSSDVLSFFDDYAPIIEFISTRDEVSYGILNQELDLPIHDGICCSFYLKNMRDTFADLKLPNHVAWAFDNFSGVSVIDKKVKKSFGNLLRFGNSDLDSDGKVIIRVNHGSITQIGSPFRFKNTYYSDIPFGYLSIYKSVDSVFSDRVHAIAGALAMGAKAMYLPTGRRSRDGRFHLLNRICDGNVFEEPTRLNTSAVDREFILMKDFIVGILK
jgi:hypothetical protein